jgi:hypothetical protein
MVPVARLAVWPCLLSSAFAAIALSGACATAGDAAIVGSGQPTPTWDGAASGTEGGGASPGADANACRPGDVGTYQPAYHPASAAWQGLCRPDLISGFYDACLGPLATGSACAAFKADKTAGRCASCILTSDTATHYGPLVDHGTFITTNVAGCIELTDPSGLSCAKSLQALSGCELAACEANCPVQDPASRAVYDQCAVGADQAGCGSYVALATCADDEVDAGLAQNCLIGTFADFYNTVVPLFCGAPQVDGGVAPFDAASAGLSSDASPDAQPVALDAASE